MDGLSVVLYFRNRCFFKGVLVGHGRRAMLTVRSDYGVSESVGPRGRNTIFIALHFIYYSIMKKFYQKISTCIALRQAPLASPSLTLTLLAEIFGTVGQGLLRFLLFWCIESFRLLCWCRVKTELLLEPDRSRICWS